MLLRIFPAAPLFAAFLIAASAFGAEPEPTAESSALFKEGVEHLQQERYAEAYEKFKEAYALTPRWTVLGNIGLAAENLERDGEAIDVMEDYLERGGAQIDPAEAREVRTAIERLKSGSATVTLEAPGAFWIVDTRVYAGGAVVNEYGPFDGKAQLRVRPGRHEFKLDRASIEAPTWTVPLAAANTATHAFEPIASSGVVEVEPPPHQTELSDDGAAAAGSRTASYVLWGTGAGAAVATAIMAVHASNLQAEADAEFEQICSAASRDAATCSSSTGRDRQAAQWRTAAFFTGVGALGALVTGTVLYFVTDEGPSDGSVHEASVQPWVSPTGIGIMGSF